MKNQKTSCDELRQQFEMLQLEYDALKKNFDENKKHLQKAQKDLSDRIKELNCQNQITTILGHGEWSLENLFPKIAGIISGSFQFPEYAHTAIILNGFEYKTPGFKLSKRTLSREISVKDQPAGHVVVAYPDDVLTDIQDVFIPEETTLLTAIAYRLGNYLSARDYKKSLFDSEEKYRQMFFNNPQPMWIFDMETLSFLEVNDAAVSLYGYSREEFLKMTIMDIRPKDEIPELYHELENRSEIHNPDKLWRHTWKNGEERFIKISWHTINYRGRKARHAMITDFTDQTLAEAKLRAGEEKYRLLIENQNELVVKVDAEGKFLYVSPSYCSLVGKSEDELLGNSFYPLVHEEDVKPTQDEMKKLNHSPHTCYIEQRALTAKGWRWLAWSDKAQVGENGEIVSIVGTGRDITERKIAENALRASEEQFRAVSEYSFSSICILNAEGKILWVNDALLKMSGYTDEQLYSALSFVGFVDVESREFVISNFLKFVHQQPYEHHYRFSIIRADGEKRLCEKYMTHYTDQNGDRNLILSMLDITEQENSENALRESEEKHRTIFETMQDVYYEALLDGKILEISPSIEKLSNGQYTRNELIGQSLVGFYADPEARKAFFAEIARTGTVTDYELMIRKKDGSVVPVSISSSLRYAADGTPVKIAGTMRDISRRRQMEESLLQTNHKLEAIIKTSPDGIGIITLDGKLTFASEKLGAMYGYTPGEINEFMGHPVIDFIDPSNHQILLENMRRMVTGEISHKITEYQAIKKDGERFYTEHNSVPIFDDKGKMTGILYAQRDITERKTAEKRIIESEKRYRTLFETMSQGVIYHNAEGKIIAVNPSAERILGLSATQIMGKHSGNPNFITVDEDGNNLPVENHPAAKAIRTGMSEYAIVGVYLPSKEGLIWVKINSYPEFRDGEKRPFQVYTTIEDITPLKNAMEQLNATNRQLEDMVEQRTHEIKTALEALRESEEQFHSMFHQHAAVMFLVNPANGEIVEANKAASDFYKYEFDGEIKKNLFEINPMPDHELKHVIELAVVQHRNYFIFPHRLASGEIRTVEVHSTPIQVQGKQVLFSIIHDITERKIAEEALVKSKNTLTQITDSVPVFIALADVNLQYTFVNSAYEAFFGLKKENIIGQPIKNIMGVEAFERAYPYLQKALQGESSTFENHLDNIRGETRDIQTSYAPYYNNNKIEGILATVIDITERKKGEELLRKSVAENRAIIQSMPDLLFKLSRDGVYLDYHCCTDSILYAPKEVFLGKKIKEILPPELAGISMLKLKNAFSSDELVQYEYSLPSDGEVRFYENRIVAISDNEALSIIRDITDQKKAETELREAMQKLSSLVQNLHAGTLFENENRKISLVNQSFCNLFNIPLEPEQMAGFDCVAAAESSKSLMTDPEGFIRRVDEVISEGQLVVNDELYLLDGRVLERDYVPIRHENVLVGHLWQYHNITERKQNENFNRLQKEFATGLAAISNLNQALELTLNTMLEIAGIDIGGIYLFDNNTGIPNLMIHKGLSEKFAAIVADYKPDEEQVKQILSGKPIYGPYKEIVRTRFSAEETDFLKSLAIIPLQHKEIVIGVINLGSRSMETIGKKTMNMVEALANQAGMAISRIYAESALLASKQNFQMLFDTIDDFLFILDSEGKMMITNPVVQHRLGYTADELSVMNVLEIHPPERREEAGFIVNEMLAGRELFCPVPLITKDGAHIPVETRVIKGKWDDKDVLYGISRDITERQKAEAALRMQAAAFESFALAIIITDIEGKIQWANSSFTKLSGYSQDEIIGKTPGVLVRSGQQDHEFSSKLWQTIRQGHVWSGELINRRKDGTMYYEEQTITPVMDYDGNIINFIAIKIDITERKRLFQELATEKRRLADIINGTNAGTWEWNIPTGETIFNEQWAAIIGYTLEEISPVNIETWMKYSHPDDLKTSSGLLQKHFSGELDYYSFESRMKHKNGEWVWVLDRGKVHEWDSEGKPVMMSGTHLDITQQKRIEADLFNAKNEAEKANKAKSEFLSLMSHELRTPMNSILGFAQLLDMGGLNTTQRKGVNYILKSGKHLLDLINEVLDIARIEAGRLSLSIEPVKVRGIIMEMIDIFKQSADEKHISIQLTGSPANDEFIEADKQRAKQVLINLLNNAIKYNRQGGSVVIKAEVRPENEKGQTPFRISISDTGIGISPENISRLFQPFERIGAEKTTIEGTGLGLAVVSKLMEAMKGRIGVESTLDTGSTFWVEFPISKKEAVQTDNQELILGVTRHLSQKSGLVLYIEDNISNIDLVDQILTNHTPGIKLVSNSYGGQAYSMALSLNPDLILLDLNLPDMHGSEVLQILLSDNRTRNIPVVIISADAMSNQINALMRAGAKNYLTKPIDVPSFLQVINTWIGEYEK